MASQTKRQQPSTAFTQLDPAPPERSDANLQRLEFADKSVAQDQGARANDEPAAKPKVTIEWLKRQLVHNIETSMGRQPIIITLTLNRKDRGQRPLVKHIHIYRWNTPAALRAIFLLGKSIGMFKGDGKPEPGPLPNPRPQPYDAIGAFAKLVQEKKERENNKKDSDDHLKKGANDDDKSNQDPVQPVQCEKKHGAKDERWQRAHFTECRENGAPCQKTLPAA